MVKVTGGDRLGQFMKNLAAKLSNASTVEIGFMEDATYPDGTKVAMVAAIQEYGAPSVGIPPRPFFRNMIQAKSGEWPEAIAGLLVANDFDAQKTLTQMGNAVSGQLKQSIEDLTSPPLSPVTLMVRKIVGPLGRPTLADVLEARRRVAAGETAGDASTKPLIATGNLRDSVTFKVNE